MQWSFILTLNLLLLYPLPALAPFPPPPHRDGWHPDKPPPGMILPGPEPPPPKPPPPKPPPPHKKILPYGAKCVRPNVIGAEETGLMIDHVDGYPSCYTRCIIRNHLEGCPPEDFCLMERKGPWFWKFEDCLVLTCRRDHPQEEQDRLKYQRLWWEKENCPGGKSEDPPFGRVNQPDWSLEDDRADRDSKHNEHYGEGELNHGLVLT